MVVTTPTGFASAFNGSVRSTVTVAVLCTAAVATGAPGTVVSGSRSITVAPFMGLFE